MAILAGCIGAEVVIVGFWGEPSAGGDHFRVNLKDIGRLGDIHHIRIMAAGGPHIYLHHGIIPGLPDAVIVLCNIDELKMDKPPVCPEGLYGLPSQFEQSFGNVRGRVKMNVLVILNGIQDRRIGAHGFKQRLTVLTDDSVIGTDISGQEFLHHIGNRRQLIIKRDQVVLRLKLHRSICADTDIRLYDHRIADCGCKLPSCLEVRDNVLARGGDACFQKYFLHGGFLHKFPDSVLPGADSNIEIRPQTRVCREPVFIQGFQPVYPAVFMDKKRGGPIYLVILFKGIDIIILCQGVFELIVELIVGHISDSEHIYSKPVQTVTEICTGDGVGGGNKNKIHKGSPFGDVV